MQNHIDLLKATRANILKAIDGISLEQLNLVPEGYNNNLIWNAGHVAVTQQLLCYAKSDLQVKLPKDMIATYRKGAKPERDVTQAEVEQIKSLLTESIEWLATDLAAGTFKTFKTYPTSYGYTLNSIEDAVNFNNVHEAMHLGYIIAMKKHLGV